MLPNNVRFPLRGKRKHLISWNVSPTLVSALVTRAGGWEQRRKTHLSEEDTGEPLGEDERVDVSSGHTIYLLLSWIQLCLENSVDAVSFGSLPPFCFRSSNCGLKSPLLCSRLVSSFTGKMKTIRCELSNHFLSWRWKSLLTLPRLNAGSTASGGSVWLVSVSVSLSYFLLPASSPISPLYLSRFSHKLQPHQPVGNNSLDSTFPLTKTGQSLVLPDPSRMFFEGHSVNNAGTQAPWIQESLFPAGRGWDSLKSNRHLISVCWTNGLTFHSFSLLSSPLHWKHS